MNREWGMKSAACRDPVEAQTAPHRLFRGGGRCRPRLRPQGGRTGRPVRPSQLPPKNGPPNAAPRSPPTPLVGANNHSPPHVLGASEIDRWRNPVNTRDPIQIRPPTTHVHTIGRNKIIMTFDIPTANPKTATAQAKAIRCTRRSEYRTCRRAEST